MHHGPIWIVDGNRVGSHLLVGDREIGGAEVSGAAGVGNGKIS